MPKGEKFSFVLYIIQIYSKGDGIYSFKSQSLPSSEDKVPDLPTYFDRNGKSH